MVKKIILPLILVASLIIVAIGLAKRNPGQTNRLNIADRVEINIDIADTPSEHAQGYSNHQPIGFGEGLLFVFDRPDRYQFWMKDMLFDLDFVMIRDGVVTKLVKNVPAPVNNRGETEVINPQKPFDRLLEVRSGFIDKYGIKTGDSVELSD